MKWLDRLERDGWVCRSADRRLKIVQLAVDATDWRPVQTAVSVLQRET